MQVELWPIDRPKDYPKNARKWSPRAVEKVAASIREYGWRQPVVVDADDVIVIGHLRRTAGRSLGLTEIPVHVARDLTPAQIRGLRLADNRTNQEAAWDEELLGPELAELSDLGFDLNLTGFDVHELDVLLRDPMDEDKAEQAPPLPEVAVTKPGELWLLGPHQVLCGDATSPAAVARLLGERKPKLLVTDPPYGIQLDSEWRDKAGLNGHGPAEPSYLKHRTVGHRNTTISSDTRADWSQAFELVPSIQIAYVWHASVYTREVLNGLERIGFLYPQQIIWNKGRAVLTRTHYWYGHEPCLYVRKKNAAWFGKAGENSTVWEVPSPKFIMGGSDEAKCDHPTQKPLELMRRPILNHTKRGELVYDAFLGSGTTLMAAELTERICLGMELDPKYVDVIIQRWQEFTGKQATLAGEGKSFEQVSVERLGSAVATNEKAPPGTKPGGAKGKR
jgi:DNA modification methylase